MVTHYQHSIITGIFGVECCVVSHCPSPRKTSSKGDVEFVHIGEECDEEDTEAGLHAGVLGTGGEAGHGRLVSGGSCP